MTYHSGYSRRGAADGHGGGRGDGVNRAHRDDGRDEFGEDVPRDHYADADDHGLDEPLDVVLDGDEHERGRDENDAEVDETVGRIVGILDGLVATLVEGLDQRQRAELDAQKERDRQSDGEEDSRPIVHSPRFAPASYGCFPLPSSRFEESPTRG